jgi:hypothetical protein
MNCVQCSSPYSTTDNFCRNCGTPVKYAPPRANNNEDNAQAVTLLLVYLCWSFFIALVYFLLNKFAFRGTGGMNVGRIYDMMGWFTQGGSFLLLLIFSIIVKSNRVRIFLIIFTVIEFLLIIGYRLMRN